IENGLGRVQTIEYAPSTRFALEDAAHGQAWTNQLPFPVSLVSRVLTEDSLGHSYETRFSYHQGYYDAGEKEFRGFAVAEKIETGDTTAPTLVTRSSFDVGREFEAMKGRQLRLTTEQEDGQPFWDEATTWTTPPRLLHAGANGRDVVFVHPTGRRKVISELGQGDPRTVESEFAYDEFGNQTLEANYGIVENGDRSAWDDERVTTNSFAINLDAWILRRPSRTEVRDEEGTVLSRAENFYDDPTFSGNNLGVVTRGDLTLRREWFDAAQPGSYLASLRAQFDAFGNRILLLDPLAQAAGGGPVPAAGHYREVAYDDRFHAYPVQETLHVGAGRPALQAGAEHDFGFGRLTATHDFNGLITSCRYDAFGRLLSLARPGDSPGYPSTEYAYGLAQLVGSNGLVNFVETRRLDQPAVAGTHLDHYHVTRQFFDGLGRALLTKTEAEGPAATPNQSRVILTGATLFNARLQPWRVLAPCFSTQPGASLESLLAYESVAAPDWVGRFHVNGVELEADLAGAPQTTTEYDALLRTREVTQADGAHRRNFYGPLASEQSDENDTDPSSPHAGTPGRFVFDGLGRQVRTEERARLNDDGTPASEVATWVTEFAWDLNDQLVRITDAQHNVKALRYDGLKRLVWMNDPDRGVSTYAYDAASNRIQSEDARGQKIRFAYDGLNRLIAEDYLDENAPFSRHHPFDPAQPISTQNRPDVAYFYDQAVANLDFGDGTTGTARNVLGELGYAWDLSGEEHFSYDERRRHEWSVKRILDPADPDSARLTSFRTVHEYDRLDRETRLIYPDNDEITFQYNSRQLLQSISGGLSGSIVTRQDYLPSGQLGQAEFGNGVQTRYAYDARARLQRLSVAPAHGQGAPLLDLSYELDGASNLIGLADQRPALMVPAGDPRRNSQTFAYDDLYRLTRAGYSFAAPGGATTDGAVQCRYDRLGNLLHQSSSVAVPAGEPDPSLGDLHYGGAAGASGRVGRTSQDPGPHALTSLVNSGDTEEILYDENGNVLQLEGSTATWDFLNRLVAVESDTMRAEYTYDHHNQRVTRRVTAKSGAAAGRKPDTTLYVDKHFEVRNGTPVKYVFNPAGRVARVTGSLSTRARVQRLQ
ncbi:MAG TPA: toxin TcdB middle/N-terminal domain-containing protein, partial [Candidatus Saccharimonadales bacterium]|nr:toxin TcdB middle/N-terminal domain-containing protein [Candidatus Saccharimonadales bacterium]